MAVGRIHFLEAMESMEACFFKVSNTHTLTQRTSKRWGGGGRGERETEIETERLREREILLLRVSDL